MVLSKERPLYRQIYGYYRGEILRGALRRDDKLASKRKLAAQLNVSLRTVDAAYDQLLAEGYIRSEPRRGYYVCGVGAWMPEDDLDAPAISPAQTPPRETRDAAGKGDIDFSPGGIAKEHFPYNTWRKLLRQCVQEDRPALLERSPLAGLPALREAIAAYLHRARGVRCARVDGEVPVVIGSGTDNLLQMLAALLPKNGCVAIENPAYYVVDGALQRVGLRTRRVDIDEAGVPVRALEREDFAAVYCTPSHQFPLGDSMPVGRRGQLLRWAAQSGDRYIIEDDYDSEFRYNAKPLPSMQGLDRAERVVYLGSFSKSVAPSLRVAYMVLPPALYAAFCALEAQGVHSQCSALEQLVLAGFMRCKGATEDSPFASHVLRMRKLYRDKRDWLVRCLSQTFGDQIRVYGEHAGNHLLVRLTGDAREDDRQLCERAREEGAIAYPISQYFAGEPPKEHRGKVLLGYAALREEQIQEGVRRLHRAWNAKAD